MDSINTQLKAWLRSEDSGKALELAWSPNLPAVSAQLQAEPEGIHYTLTTYDWFNPVSWPANDSTTPNRAIRGADDRRYYIFPPPNSAALNHGYNPTIPRYPKVVLEFDRFAEADFIPENDNMDLHPDDLFDSLSVEIGRITDIENMDGQPSACGPVCKGHTISEQESDKAEAKLSVRHLATFHPRREEYKTSAHFHIDFIQPVPLRTVNNAVLSILKLSFLKRMNGTVGIDESAFGQDPDHLAQRLWQWRNMRYGHRDDLKRPSANHTDTLQDPHTLYRYAYTLLCWIALDYLGLDSLKPLTLRII